MKTALYQKKSINLNHINREEFQKLYESGRKGLLTCRVCGEPVRLYLGIQSAAHFYHHFNRNSSCQDPVLDSSSPMQEEKNYVEQNGFRLPQSRAIISTEANEPYKTAQILKVDSPFHGGKSSLEAPATGGYLQELTKAGVQFDHNQAKAVMSTEGPLLILAGAGSGKTRVLTARTAFILSEKETTPERMMLVTFTAKAANEMKKRLSMYPNMNQSKINRIVSGTFHSIFYKILIFHQREKWSGDRILKKDWQREQILKETGRKLGLEDKEFAYDLALQQISYWKNTMVLPNHVKPDSPWEEKIALLYKGYEDSKEKHGYFDFDDMLNGCHQLFSNEPQLLEQYQNRFDYFLIDEFQDINKVQYELIKMLSFRSKNVCAVGDDDQSIYAFRGSDPRYLLQFERDFSDAKTVILNQNYRSPHEIVETANKVISINQQRHQKKMKAQYSIPFKPILFYPYDEEEEATMILTDIQEKIENGANPQDFAILFRTNTASRAVFERLAASSLPFKMDQEIESFYDRFMVKGILGFLRLSLNEDDSEAIKQILPSLFLKQSIFRDLQAESILKDCSMLEALSHVKTGFAFQEQKLKKLIPIVRSLRTKSPLGAIEIVEKDLGFQDFIKKRGNEGNQLEKGSDDLRDLRVAMRSFSTVAEFIEHSDHISAMNREIRALSKKTENAIILSTIHRAKGLEYSHVYILGTVDGSLPHDFALDSLRNGDQEPLEEERRLLYVAITRAMERLYLSVPQYRRGRKAQPSRFLSHLRKESIEPHIEKQDL
ncbi:ATP-dependent helicase [Mesobacillus maritimus]|uniref:UvrD-helicase domain-containing protein n=1 Tax=Mesobacillus maritimus TaxID=1643336 RepID=UPI0020410050|nr:ATP-dependent helicase [Mesobacillus maritimus]MCM3667510.1 ATP-dependent helicase [Mesobacillus maritimus]